MPPSNGGNVSANASGVDSWIVCPPSAPPPTSPPDFSTWSAAVPAWFWMLLAMLTLLSVVGTTALVYLALREYRRGGQSSRLPGSETRAALAELEAQGRRIHNRFMRS